MTMAHSPTPWPMPIYDNHGNGGFSEWWEIPSIAKVYTAADAEFIFSAANCHDELVAALKEVIEATTEWDLGTLLLDRAKEILAKAEAK